MKSLFFLSALFISAVSSANELKCVGTEPFWGATVNLESQTVLLQTPFGKKVDFKIEVKAAEGATSDFAFMGTSEYFMMSVVKTENCNDGKSDLTYPYQVLLTAKNYVGQWQRPLVGCCK